VNQECGAGVMPSVGDLEYREAAIGHVVTRGTPRLAEM
jgi:hypothetical protein